MDPMYDLVVIAIIVVSVMSNLYYSRIPETEQVVSTRTECGGLSRRSLQIEDSLASA